MKHTGASRPPPRQRSETAQITSTASGFDLSGASVAAGADADFLFIAEHDVPFAAGGGGDIAAIAVYSVAAAQPADRDDHVAAVVGDLF